MKIAFYLGKYGTLYDKIIMLVTLSKYSHCEIVFSDGVSASSSPRDGGVRFKKINFNERWSMYEIKNVDVNPDQVRQYFNENLGDKYNWIGAVLSAFNISYRRKHIKFCSEACSQALKIRGTHTPASLYKSLLKSNYITSGVTND